MKVLLQRNWFTPFGRYKKSATKKGPPVEIPDSLRGRLPSDAIVVDDDKPIYEPGSYDAIHEETMSMAEAAEAEGLDMERMAADNEQHVRDLADGVVRKNTVQQIKANAVEFQKELNAENAEKPMSKAAQKKAAMQAEVDAHNAKGK